MGAIKMPAPMWNSPLKGPITTPGNAAFTMTSQWQVKAQCRYQRDRSGGAVSENPGCSAANGGANARQKVTAAGI